VSWPVFTLFELSFAVFGLLPRLFLRGDGRFHLMWWVTAVPFFAMPVVLPIAQAGLLSRLDPESWRTPLETVSVVFAVASLALVFVTLGTHRVRLALWHQEDDAPHSIVTSGPYHWIRHPFYTSFLLGFGGAAIAFPNPLTIGLFLYAVVALNATAAREERRLGQSAFGAEYRAYVGRTGRFLPVPSLAPQPSVG
jgi:protein-S-isoprenylcysteine O-methyltransferase Ste14